MAIEIDLNNSQYGVPFNGAYFRIVTASVSRTREDNPRHSVMIDVAGYASVPEHEDVREVDFRRYHVPAEDVYAIEAENFFAQCYLWVMAQPDMAGSVGV